MPHKPGFKVSAREADTIRFITEAEGISPIVNLDLDDGAVSPVWTPQIRHRRQGMLIASDFGVAATTYTVSFPKEEIYHLWIPQFQTPEDKKLITGLPTKFIYPKRFTIDNWFMTSNGPGAGSVQWNVDLWYTLEGFTGVKFPVFYNESGSSFTAGQLNTIRVVDSTTNFPHDVLIDGYAQMINHEIAPGDSYLINNAIAIASIDFELRLSVALSPITAGMNVSMYF